MGGHHARCRRRRPCRDQGHRSRQIARLLVNKPRISRDAAPFQEDDATWLVYLSITDEQYLEIFPGAENDRAPGWHANGMNHICFTIDDLDATVARIKAAGITLFSPAKEGLDGNRQAWLEDPDGNRIELMEMAPDCVQYQAIKRLHAEGK